MTICSNMKALSFIENVSSSHYLLLYTTTIVIFLLRIKLGDDNEQILYPFTRITRHVYVEL